MFFFLNYTNGTKSRKAFHLSMFFCLPVAAWLILSGGIISVRGHPLSTYAKFSEKLTILTYQGVRNVSFSENFAYILKGYLRYKTIFGHKVVLDV